jgi:hypothetical protein
MIVSPDRCKHRLQVLDAIREGLPDLEVRVIQDIPFEEYVELEKQAKWSLTFGEGCDGYFYGPARRGGVPFAVRNHTFAGHDTAGWVTLFDSYEDMAARIVDILRSLDDKDRYEAYTTMLRPCFMRADPVGTLRTQLRRFYAGEYRWAPRHYSKADSDLGAGVSGCNAAPSAPSAASLCVGGEGNASGDAVPVSSRHPQNLPITRES